MVGECRRHNWASQLMLGPELIKVLNLKNKFAILSDLLKASGIRIDEQGHRYIRVKGVRWFTNMDYKQRHDDLILYKKYRKFVKWC